jgi:hypothetical protein
MSLDQNLGTHLQTIDLLPMQSVTADGNGTGVDLQQFVGSVAIVLAAKNTAGSTPTLDIKLQDSADNSTFADIAGATFTQVTDAGTSAAVLEKISLNVNACARYVRAVKDIGGTSSPAFDVTVVGLGVKQVR